MMILLEQVYGRSLNIKGFHTNRQSSSGAVRLLYVFQAHFKLALTLPNGANRWTA